MVAVIIGIAGLHWFVKAATGLAGDCDPAPVAADKHCSFEVARVTDFAVRFLVGS